MVEALVKKRVFTLDLSTTSTGWACFDSDTKKLIGYGAVKGSEKGLGQLTYPKKQLVKMRQIAHELLAMLEHNKEKIDKILIEEVNLHKSRLTGKVLDGLHWILLNYMSEEILSKVVFVDSDGFTGWRTKLGLKLNEDDKEVNKQNKLLNKKIKRGKLPIINKKHLACRYVNSRLGTNFDVDANVSDNDIVDAIGLGLSYFLGKS